MDSSPAFENPPLVEFVLGVQFSPLTELRSAHFGLFWATLRNLPEDWQIANDATEIPDQFELFNTPLWRKQSQNAFRFEMGGHTGRCQIENQSRDRMIQVQQTRFHLNWRKSEGQKPGYKDLMAEFVLKLEAFCRFCKEEGIGEVIPNQWEITAVNSFPVEEYWSSPEEWDRVLPGLFGNRFDSHELGMRMERRRVEWSFEIEPALGRLHVTAQSAKWARDPKDSLLLDLTCRGPVTGGSFESTFNGLDIGHQIVVETFLKITPAELQERWRP